MPPATRPADTTPATDPLLETEVFWMKYRIPIIGALVAIILGAAAFGAYLLYAQRAATAAAAQLAQAKTDADYQKVIAQHGGTPAAASAYLFLAAELRKKRDFAGASHALEKFISGHPKHELITTARMGVAANLESLGKPDEALETYRRIAADYPKSFNAPLAMLAQVPLLKAKGEVDQARQVCETVLTQFRDSAAAQEATRYLRSLKPAGAATPPAAPQPAAETPAAPPAATP